VRGAHLPERRAGEHRAVSRLAGLVGLAIGFGAQNLVRDFVSGVFNAARRSVRSRRHEPGLRVGPGRGAIAHNVDLERAEQVALDAAHEAVADESTARDVLGAPEMLGVQEISADMVTLRVLIKTRPNAQWSLQRRVRKQILAAYEENDIRLPYPNGRELGPSALVSAGEAPSS
jgi:small conductance mechanosensitive channel